MRLLVTGASGLLGTRLCEIAMSKCYEVYSSYNQHKPRHGKLMRLDITDRKASEKIFEMTKPEAVIHAAALTDVDRCEREKDLAYNVNVEGTTNITKLCNEYHSFLVYISTDYVFDGSKGMYKESDVPVPINIYGQTKTKSEEIVKGLADEYCIARGSVIYGSIPAVGKTNFALWLLEQLKRKKTVRIVTDQWNSPTLNTNLAEMVIEVLERRIAGTIHLAGATRLSRYEFSLRLAETFNLSSSYITPVLSDEIPWIAKRPTDSSLSVDKANRTLKTKPLQIIDALEKMKKELSHQGHCLSIGKE